MSLADETIVAMLSDHGESLGSRRMVEKGPSMYEKSRGLPLSCAGCVRNGGVSPRFLAVAHRITFVYI